ncbi:MAG: hypothetical protein HY913_06225 [Desulfomonile tiedjei]|nr:hypothetical protein [Desulfomonile tiedjei]
MKRRLGYGARAWVPYLLGVAAILLVVGPGQSLLIVDIGGRELALPVSEGDVFVHTYTHSMYDVPVSEKFRIEGDYLRLVQVTSLSEAALEYLGIERRDEFNVDLRCRGFTIPAGSIGNHVFQVRDREIDLGNPENREEAIQVKLVRVRALVYFVSALWR